MPAGEGEEHGAHHPDADAEHRPAHELDDGAAQMRAASASAVTAPARNRLTNGVAMPSFSPLSTLSVRRTPEGTRSSAMIVAPRAASVGATMAPMAAATHSPLLPKRRAAVAAPAAMVSGSPMTEQAGRG